MYRRPWGGEDGVIRPDIASNSSQSTGQYPKTIGVDFQFLQRIRLDRRVHNGWLLALQNMQGHAKRKRSGCPPADHGDEALAIVVSRGSTDSIGSSALPLARPWRDRSAQS